MSEALAGLPMAVVVVAAAHGGERTCSTGTLTYVSYDPPLVATPLAASSHTLRLLREAGEFSVSVLAANQSEIAVRAAQSSSGDKFAEQSIGVLDGSVPAVADASLVLYCALISVAQAGAHRLCVGEVRSSLAGNSEPLLRYDHAYRALGDAVTVAEEADYPL